MNRMDLEAMTSAVGLQSRQGKLVIIPIPLVTKPSKTRFLRTRPVATSLPI
jgi:hypothetical protein